MGTNVTVDTIPTLGAATALTKMNANFSELADEFDKVVYKDGREELTGDLDANSNRIINLPEPASPAEPVRVADLDDYLFTNLPQGSVTVSTDGNFAANSDTLIPTQKAVKTYFEGSRYRPTGTAVFRTFASKFAEHISVKDFGAIGDGVTDDTAAFIAAIQYAAAQRVNPDPAGGTNPVGRVVIHVPEGGYKITSTILQATDFAGRTLGFSLIGTGAGTTQIIYRPSSSVPLFINNDKLLFVRMSGIQFDCNNSNASFLESTSSGGAQDYRFSDCLFSGTWKYGIWLTGANTNSEYSFEKCTFSGVWTQFLFSDTSDQFLNYWFSHCKYWSSSPWLRMLKGGNIKISNCDVSGYQPAVYTYLFSLEGAVHGNGVCSFVCSGTRFELKNSNAGVLFSQWPQGNILFIGCDQESQSSFFSAFATTRIEFQNVGGPVVSWINCSLMGTHVYYGAISQWAHIARITYDTCFFTQVDKVGDFFTLSHAGNPGSVPSPRVTNCRAKSISSAWEMGDTAIGWRDANRSVTSKKIVRVGAPATSAPILNTTETIKLPLNSIITKVTLYNRAGSTSNNGAYSWTIRTNEGTPTVLASVSGANLSLGFTVHQDLFFDCNSETKRTINVVDLSNITNIGDCVFVIEYI
jgi:hypothetical protein